MDLGADAMDNMFDIEITLPNNVKGAGDGIKSLPLRATGFNPPVFKTKTYKNSYKAVSISRPAAKIEGERQFDIEFRLDALYFAYDVFKVWKGLVNNASTGYASNELNEDDLGAVAVSALKKPITIGTAGYTAAETGVSSGKIGAEGNHAYSYDGVWITEVGEPAYKTDGGDALFVKITFQFGQFADPLQGNALLAGSPGKVTTA
jgi:hypothetical protein